VSRPLGVAASEAANRLTPEAADILSSALLNGQALTELRRLIPAPGFGNVVDDLAARAGDVSPEQIGAALSGAAAALVETRTRTTELVWTGPRTDHIEARLTAQALGQVIDAANYRLVVSSFAVYKVEEVAEALVRAAARGARVDLIVESVLESGGAISFDGVNQLGEEALKACHLYTWPAMRRPIANNKPGALHAKFAVADASCLLVTSANLTGHALGLNMELGVLVTGGDAPRAVVGLVDDLIHQGDLAPRAFH
jgi:cardiolipin synthase